MKRQRYPPRWPSVTPVALPAHWTPGEAVAVYELLDDLRRVIWGHYQLRLLESVPEDDRPGIDDDVTTCFGEPASLIAIRADWTPEEASAVFGMIDTVLKHVSATYERDLLGETRRQRQGEQVDRTNTTIDDPTF